MATDVLGTLDIQKNIMNYLNCEAKKILGITEQDFKTNSHDNKNLINDYCRPVINFNTYRCGFYESPYFSWISPPKTTYVVINNPSQTQPDEKEKEKEKKDNTMLKVAAGTIVIGMCALLGYATAKRANSEYLYSKYASLSEEAALKNYNNSPYAAPKWVYSSLNDFRSIIDIKLRFQIKMENSAFAGLASAVSLVAGAFFSIPVLTTCGSLGLIGSLGYGVYHYSIYSGKSEAIVEKANNILTNTNSYIKSFVDQIN